MEQLVQTSQHTAQAEVHNPALTASTFDPRSGEVLPPRASELTEVNPVTSPSSPGVQLLEVENWQNGREETDMRGELPVDTFAPHKMRVQSALMLTPPGQEHDSGMSEADFQALVARGDSLYRPASGHNDARPNEQFPMNEPYVAKNEATVALDAMGRAAAPADEFDVSATALLPRLSARLADMRARRAARNKPAGYKPGHRRNTKR